MAAETNLEFLLGETWSIGFELNDAAGEDLDLTSATVKFRLFRNRVRQLAFSTPGAEISVDSPSNGNGTIRIPPSAQVDLVPAVYEYEVRVTLQDGQVSTQAFGALTLARSLF